MYNINSIDDLKKLLLPALTIKKDELSRIGYKRIEENHIFDILFNEEWSKKNYVSLCDVVDNVLNYDNYKMIYLFRKYELDDQNIELPKLKGE